MAKPAIEQFLLQRAGLYPESIGPRNIERAVAAAMERTGVHDESEYLALLKRSDTELPSLIDAIVVPETWFFRDREPFVFLKKHVQTAWLPLNSGRRLRVLSAACSTGEESYSIAITLLEAGLAPGQFHIDAVDISEGAIQKARGAAYGERAFRGSQADSHARYFRQLSGRFILDEGVARLVNFHVDNLVDPVFLATQEPYQVVFCRNMIIYLSDEARSLVLKNLARLLVPSGILVVGHSELTFFQQAGYAPVSHARSFACIKDGAAERMRKRRSPAGTKRPATAVPPVPEHRIADLLQERPAAVCPPAGLDVVRRLADQGDLENARSLCERIIRDQPPGAEAYCLLGLIHQASDRLHDAEACYLKAVYLDPRCVEALVHLGLCYARRGDETRAALIRDRARRIETAIV